ncbi:hypothetical protein K1T71_002691 [Dendrolimus kikuchii]|uniref:Uncharacterized protein n=1 Tax=Dendrolimus kikuchii TaxID=765133 RepID=A0ACC1DDB8_9NEOP|nr:hypothetical protein K1T71_002691 [Dendrolimus kikuchii]
MGLYKLFSYNVEVQYKNYFLSKAMLFSIAITLLNVILPFVIAYKSRGFWLKSQFFYEQPSVKFTYEYLLVAETEDPKYPIVCGEISSTNNDIKDGEENCAEFHVQEYDYKKDGKNDMLYLNFKLLVPKGRSISSILILLGLDCQLQTLCPLHIQSLAVIHEKFTLPPTGLKFYGDLYIYQIAHLPCLVNNVDTKYNSSVFKYERDGTENIIDLMLSEYFNREVITQVKPLFSRSEDGHTGAINIIINVRIPETLIRYTPNALQELIWAWPQYLSLVVLFYWFFKRIKRFIFNKRLLMAWEITPWKKQQ